CREHESAEPATAVEFAEPRHYSRARPPGASRAPRRRTGEANAMVEKTIDLIGTSQVGIEDAVALAVKRASVTVKNIRQAKVVETVALVDGGGVTRWRVRVEVTFGIQDSVHE